MNLKSLRNPDLYHGRLAKNCFEGWYFKLVDRKMERAFAFIPGVFYNKSPENDHAFIQVVDGIKRSYQYLRFPADQFNASGKVFSLQVAGSSFGLNGLAFNLDRDQSIIKGSVIFTNHLKWPDSFINPGSMGFYNYILKMQCYSQVCAMDFDLTGQLDIYGELVDFSGGKGYIEKNWGAAFPYSWIWIQSNHFEKARASLSCSLAHIPFPIASFRGFLVGLYVEGRFYPFTTMNRSKVEVMQSGTDVIMHFLNRRYTMSIECETSNDDFILLNGPRDDAMVPLVQENLQGLVQVTLKERDGGKVIYHDRGYCSGVEYGGEQMMVVG